MRGIVLTARASQLVDFERFGETLRADTIDAAEDELRRGALLKRRADQDQRAIILVETFQPGREIHRGAERGVVHAVLGSDIADDGLAGVETAPRPVDRPAF